MPLDVAPNELDLSAWWMPFTANRQFKAAPRLFASANGMHYRTAEGREVLDGTAGLWCVNAGHGRPEIADAVHRQLTRRCGRSGCRRPATGGCSECRTPR